MLLTKEDAISLRRFLEKSASNIDDDAEALTYRKLVEHWKTDTEYVVGDRVAVVENGSIVLYKCKSEHTSQENWKPSINTASLWVKIDEVHQGTLEDPIPYAGNMILEAGKYYIQDSIVYKCTRDSGNPLYNDLKDLINLYVEKV